MKSEGLFIPSPVYHICRILLGLIFVVASLDKIAMPWMFGRAVVEYEILTGSFGYLTSLVVIILPALELVTGVLLIANKLVRPSAILLLAMNIFFILIIFSAMIRGLNIECGCGLDDGPISVVVGTQADWGAILRDIIFVVMNVIVLTAPQSKSK